MDKRHGLAGCKAALRICDEARFNLAQPVWPHHGEKRANNNG
jgi:hypothetical protein